MTQQLVSEQMLHRLDREAVTAVFGAAALMEDDYRPRIATVMKRIICGSPVFELLLNVTSRVEPHFGTLGAFNAAFTQAGATVHKFYDAPRGALTTKDKWHIVTTLMVSACPQPVISAEEQLTRCSRGKGEAWIDFVDRYVALCRFTSASREMQTKTLFKKLPASFRRLIMHLPPGVNVEDMMNVIRNASYWEAGTQSAGKQDVDEDGMDIDMSVVQANMASDGKVVQNGRINFGAITTVGRVMVAAREVCKGSRREAINLLRFLQRTVGNTESSRRGPPQNRHPRQGRTYLAENTEINEEIQEICETIDDEAEEEEEHFQANMAAKAKTKGEKKRILKLSLTAQSHLGYRRRIDALVDTGAETSIMSLGLAKELGLKIQPDNTRLMMAHGQATRVVGKCTLDVAVDKAPNSGFLMTCLVLPKPGYDMLLGLDSMTENEISTHPHSRSVSIRGRHIKCLFAGGVSERDTHNEIARAKIGEYTEKVTQLPIKKGDRIVFPLNRSIVLGPNETRMVKTPVVLERGLVPQRTPTIASHFSVHLGSQYANYTALTLCNHKEEPIRVTAKTIIFELPAQEQTEYQIQTEDGKTQAIKSKKLSFAKRQ